MSHLTKFPTCLAALALCTQASAVTFMFDPGQSIADDDVVDPDGDAIATTRTGTFTHLDASGAVCIAGTFSIDITDLTDSGTMMFQGGVSNTTFAGITSPSVGDGIQLVIDSNETNIVDPVTGGAPGIRIDFSYAAAADGANIHVGG